MITYQSLSTLHKQNFDLKLELYHRRGRQDALEARNAKLEDERAEMTEIHDNLLAELERRDQALNEAIQLVMNLENQIVDLSLGKKMTRQAGADGLNCDPCEEDPTGGRSDTPKARTRPDAYSDSDDRGLQRMPSFMNDHSEQTKTLRSVVLGKKNSLSHLRKASGSSAVPSDIKGVASPSLISVLSESSFLSIYGDGGDNDGESVLPPSIQLQSPSDASLGLTHQQEPQHSNTAPRSVSSGTFNGGSSPSARSPAVVSLLDMTSPLQQIERLERGYTNRRQPSKRTTSSHDGAASESPDLHSSPTAQLHPARFRDAKTDAQRKVMNSTPTGKNVPSHRALPPTPDTVSTSTLRQFRDPGSDMSSRASSQEFFRRPSSDRDGEEVVRHASTAASAGRREMLAWQTGADKSALPQRLAPWLPRAPRSVGETDSMKDGRNSARSLGLEPRDGGADARSEDSNFDYWMWEGARARDESPSDRDSDSLPDLFEVPGSDALFGAIRGSGFSPAPGLRRGFQEGGLVSSGSDSEEGPLGPTSPYEVDGLVAPDRRSSLGARVGSVTSSGGAPAVESCGQTSAREHRWLTSRRGRSRSSSADAASFSSQPMQTSCGPGTRRSAYPPIAGQPARSRGLSGLNGLFRRESTSEARCPSPRQHKAQLASQCSRSGRMSVPPPAVRPWDRRLPELSDDDRASATPPPIMRQRASRLVSASGDAPAASNVGRMQDQDFECVARPRTATGLDSGGSDMAAALSGTTPPRRSRWLGLGLIGGLKRGTVR